jgi:hypothetical protein
MKAGDKQRRQLRLMNSAIKEKDINSRTEGHASLDAGCRAHRSVRQDDEAASGRLRSTSRAEGRNWRKPSARNGDHPKPHAAAAFRRRGQNRGCRDHRGYRYCEHQDMGKVMAELKARYAGRMDMAKAGGIVKGLLG